MKTLVQSVLIPRAHYTKKEAINWLLRHNYKYLKVDTTPHFFRFRQQQPNFNNYYTLRLPNHIELIIGY